MKLLKHESFLFCFFLLHFFFFQEISPFKHTVKLSSNLPFFWVTGRNRYLQYLLYANFTSSIATQCHIIILTCDYLKALTKVFAAYKAIFTKRNYNLSLYAGQTGLKHNPTISNCNLKKLLPLRYVPGLRISTDTSFALAPLARSRTPSFSLILACKDSMD